MFRLLKLLALGFLAMIVISACTPTLTQALVPMFANVTGDHTSNDNSTAPAVEDPITDEDKDAYQNLCVLYHSWTELSGTYRATAGTGLLDAVASVDSTDPATQAFLKALRQAVRAAGDTAASAGALVERECLTRVQTL